MTDGAAATPWPVLRAVLDVPLHPGGEEATDALLDRAGVTAETVLVDVGCGGGEALDLARGRGATAVGIDASPSTAGTVGGDMTALPLADGVADVILAECTLCLADDVDAALSEARRILADGGRLALSDMTVDGDLPAVPSRIERALCLGGCRAEPWLVDRIEAAGFTLRDRRSHRDDLLEMRDELSAKVDYHGLLRAMGDDGRTLADGVDRLEMAVENGTVGYVSVVADTSAGSA